jgi:hypothetical protein
MQEVLTAYKCPLLNGGAAERSRLGVLLSDPVFFRSGRFPVARSLVVPLTAPGWEFFSLTLFFFSKRTLPCR